VQFTFIPQTVANNSSVKVGTTTNEPGITIRLQVTYNASPFTYESEPQVTGGDGNAILNWNVQVSTSNTNAFAKVTAVATDAQGQSVKSDTIMVRIVIAGS
jgi:hypothetical protein